MAKGIAEINKAIASIKTAGAKLDTMIQNTAVDVLTHFAEHKDTGLVNRLYLALPKGARKTAMVDWLLKFCAVQPNTEQATKEEQPFVYARDKVTDPEAAAEVMWYDLKKDKAPDDVFDLQKAVRQILAKAGKAPSLAHGDSATLKQLAKAVGIPESDVPTRPADKIKDVEPAPM